MDTYKLCDEQWHDNIMKLRKQTIVGLFKNLIISNVTLKDKRNKLLEELDSLIDTIGISMQMGNKRGHEIINQLYN